MSSALAAAVLAVGAGQPGKLVVVPWEAWSGSLPVSVLGGAPVVADTGPFALLVLRAPFKREIERFHSALASLADHDGWHRLRGHGPPYGVRWQKRWNPGSAGSSSTLRP
jgi:hypothetical protein